MFIELDHIQGRFSSPPRKFFRQYPGTILVEIVIALALFMMLITAIVPLYLGVFKSNIRDMDQLKADLYTQEAFEAVRSIRDRNFSNLVNGTYVISRGSGLWNFSGSSDVIGKYTRTINISDLSRNSNCDLVSSGGTVDIHSKNITVTISWSSGGDIPEQVSSTIYLNDWKNSSGCEQSGNLAISLAGAALSSANQRLINVTLTNLGTNPITIDKVTLNWNNSHLIQEVKIASTIVWKYNGGQSPSGKQPSGTELDIDNFTIQPNSGTISLDHFMFDADMSNTTFSIYFTMADGTVRYEQVSL